MNEHAPTTAPPRQRFARTASWALVVTLAVAACGSSDEASDGADVSTGPTAAPTTSEGMSAVPSSVDGVEGVDTLPPVSPDDDLESWGGAIARSWATLLDDRTAAAIAAVEAQTTGAHRFDYTQQLFAAEVAAFDRWSASLPGPSGNGRLDELVDVLVAEAETEQELAAAGLALGEQDPERSRAELDEVGEDLPASAYGAAYVRWAESGAALATACFDLQAAMLDLGLTLLDCTGSGTETDAIESEQATDDPTSSPTGMLFADLPAGVHDFTVFEPGLVIETELDAVVSTGPDFVVFKDGRDEELEVGFVAPLAVVPSTMAEDPGLSTWEEVPEDLGGWIDELPVTSEPVDVPGLDAMWALRADPDRMLDAVGNPEFTPIMIFDGRPNTTDGGRFQLVPVLGFGATYVGELRRDADRLIVFAVVEDGADPADPTEFIGRLVAGLR